MKKLLAPASIRIIICLLISSCSSNISIVKRHYTKGYYIETAKHEQTKKEEKTAQINTIIPLHTLSHREGQNIIAENFEKDTKAPHIVFGAGETKIHHAPKPDPSIKRVFTPIIGIAESPVLQTKQKFTEAAQYHGDDGGGRAALSLLWIVIVVILILWVIGLLAHGFGLGGLINVLLVIALILLILWLLRIL